MRVNICYINFIIYINFNLIINYLHALDALRIYVKINYAGNNTFTCAGTPFSIRSAGIGPMDLKYFL